MKCFVLVLVTAAVLFFSAFCEAQQSDEDIVLAKESEVYCISTASVRATPELIVKKINAAAQLLEKEGKQAFRKFKGKNSPFLFAGTYIWINNMNSIMLMHPIKPGLIGTSLIALKDKDGRRFFVEMIDIVKTKGQGWIKYTWPKPGETGRSHKLAFVKKAMCDGEPVMIGAGTYDIPEKEMNKLVLK
ncbi:cache domain-containing protein [Desulfonema magnum]|uniref:Double cache domain-containing protein n=1 Tax=Desulfonema magnum TaxID=45655 RepID=A0A975BI29_9BACT|nr:cache domain-containing protein [Desulfonema magnum]QTA85728.1 Double cache domain-containing protein [Desulfonema magnum]